MTCNLLGCWYSRTLMICAYLECDSARVSVGDSQHFGNLAVEGSCTTVSVCLELYGKLRTSEAQLLWLQIDRHSGSVVYLRNRCRKCGFLGV